MSYAAEPYAQFVDDLLTLLTGGVAREAFTFLPEQAPFRLSPPGPVLPSTVRVFGLADGAFRGFRRGADFDLGPEDTIVWRGAIGAPAADAVQPDEGTTFYANYEARRPVDAVPRLTDRNVGSITRLLAESFAREYAVLSKQLQAVYEAGFLETATRRDLDQLVALVGLDRRRTTFATGSVVFSRRSPAPADVFIPAGTRVSTAEPPAVTFETTEDRTLRRGELSVDAPVQATLPGAEAVVPAGSLRLIHRPILGITDAANGEPTRLGGADESDEALRARTQRALEGSGRATVGALLGVLSSLPGVREKDVRLGEDHLAHPGVVTLNVALPELDDATRLRAAELIEETRPVGVRILHNLGVTDRSPTASPGPGLVPDEGPVPVASAPATSPFLAVDVSAQLMPTTLGLTPQEREALRHAGLDTVQAFFDDVGVGEALVYNRLVASLMAIDGVLDVALQLFPHDAPTAPRHKNLIPANPDVRPVAGAIDVQVGGALIVLDVSVTVLLKGVGLIGDPSANRADALTAIAGELRDGLERLGVETLTPQVLAGMLTQSDQYDVTNLHYRAEYVDAGVRVRQQDVPLTLTGLERPWVRTVTEAAGGGTS